MSTLRIAIAGTGRIAQRMIPAIRYVDDLELVAVSSTTQARAAQFAQEHDIPRAHASLDALLTEGGVDAVYIANATAAHTPDSITALEKGVAVLCEKPFATSLAEADATLAAARQNNCLFMEGFWTLCLPTWQAAKAALEAGEIGDAHHLYADFAFPMSDFSADRLLHQPAGGCLLDRGVYPIALAVYLFGPAKTISSQHIRNDEGVDLLNTLTLSHGGGVISQLSASMISKGANQGIISGTTGRISILDPLLGGEKISISPHTINPANKSGGSGLMDRLRDALKSPEVSRHPFGIDQYTPMWQHFAEIYRSGAKQSPLISHAFSREIARIVDTAHM